MSGVTRTSLRNLPWVRAVVANLCMAVVFVSFLGCGPDATTEPAPEERFAPTLIALRVASPVLPGSEFGVELSPVVALGSETSLVIEAGERSVALPYIETSAGALIFVFDAASAAVIGEGTQQVSLRVVDSRFETEPAPWTLFFAGSVEPELETVTEGSVYFNDTIVLHGGGFISEREGAMQAHWRGTFSPDGGTPESVDVTSSLTLVESDDRHRAQTYVPIALGQLRTGHFEGGVQFDTETLAGEQRRSPEVPVALNISPPTVFSLATDEVFLGEYIVVRGGGFLHEEGATTVLSLDGVFTPVEGEPIEVSGFEIVPIVDNGAEARWVLTAAVDGKELVSSVVGYAEGVFRGDLGVSTGDGVTELVGDSAPIVLTLGGAHQVVYVSFLPGFEMSLERFGLAAATTTIEAAVLNRMSQIYDGFGVEVRAEPPVDYDPNHFARLEIGGADPNGLGLFGYDNSPGKDVYNLRLFDAIGGTNAETQADDSAGYGGVFVESLLWWATDPPLPGERPTTAPQPDPVFDWLFASFFTEPATLAELAGEGDLARVEEVNRAITALGNIIGETAAHELGHSLGLADPEGSDTVFHNPFDEPGCLMDSGSDRSLGERAALPGYAETHFCYDAPAYLERILN